MRCETLPVFIFHSFNCLSSSGMCSERLPSLNLTKWLIGTGWWAVEQAESAWRFCSNVRKINVKRNVPCEFSLMKSVLTFFNSVKKLVFFWSLFHSSCMKCSRMLSWSIVGLFYSLVEKLLNVGIGFGLIESCSYVNEGHILGSIQKQHNQMQPFNDAAWT